MKFTEQLTGIYGDKLWIKCNDFVFWAARKCNLALGGSIGIAISRKKMVNQPNDIDFLAPSFDCAQSFIHTLERKLYGRKSYWKVLVNNGSDFCPEGVITHFRFQCFMWLPICIMVLPQDKLSVWRTFQGMQIQKFSDIISAAKSLDDRDNKGRVSPEVESLVIDIPEEPSLIDERIYEESLDYPESFELPEEKWDVRGFKFEQAFNESSDAPYKK